MAGRLVPVLEVGDACLAARPAVPSGVSPSSTGSGPGLGSAGFPAGRARWEEKRAGTLRQPAAGARPSGRPGRAEGRGESEPLRGRGEPFPAPSKPRHQLPSTHREPCATPSPVVPHPLPGGAGLCVGLGIAERRGRAPFYGGLSFPVTGEQRHLLPAGTPSSQALNTPLQPHNRPYLGKCPVLRTGLCCPISSSEEWVRRVLGTGTCRYSCRFSWLGVLPLGAALAS